MIDQEAQYNKWIEQREKKESYEVETMIKRRDGEYRWHLHKASYTPETNSWVGSFTDIHDQKIYLETLTAKNQQLITINTDLDNFIYTASHDLKSPIANIEGLTLALTKKLTAKFVLDDEQNRILSMMAASTDRLKSTISALTEIAKAQKDDTEKEIVSIEKVVEDVSQDLEKLIMDNEVVIHQHIEVGEIQFAHKNLRSIFYNLLSNAIKYRSMERRPEVVIETKRQEDYIVIRVADNGIGIEEKNLQKLFTMFKRFHTHVAGTGIGLYIVKRMVENVGGKIEVESTLDVGTTFKVYLPYIA
jgi:signal transduction histidine kinase